MGAMDFTAKISRNRPLVRAHGAQTRTNPSPTRLAEAAKQEGGLHNEVQHQNRDKVLPWEPNTNI